MKDHEFPLEVKEIQLKDVVSKKHYLMCLMDSEHLEALGMESLPTCRTDLYYKCVLGVDFEVSPDVSAAACRTMLKDTSGGAHYAVENRAGDFPLSLTSDAFLPPELENALEDDMGELGSIILNYARPPVVRAAPSASSSAMVEHPVPVPLAVPPVETHLLRKLVMMMVLGT